MYRIKRSIPMPGQSKWRRIRKKVYQRAGYQCEECKRQGRTTPVDLSGGGAVVDHIQPRFLPKWRGNEKECHALSNLQVLCQTCNDRKNNDDWQLYFKLFPKKTAAYYCGRISTDGYCDRCKPHGKCMDDPDP